MPTRGAADRMLQALTDAGVKLTAQRRAVVEALAGDPTHPTAQQLFARLRKPFPGMSFATVYNTLAKLEASGLCRQLSVDGKAAPSRFDPNVDRHHHAVCDTCGSVRDVPAGATHVPAPGDFAVRTVEFLYRGLCAKCQRRTLRSPRGRTHEVRST